MSCNVSRRDFWECFSFFFFLVSYLHFSTLSFIFLCHSHFSIPASSPAAFRFPLDFKQSLWSSKVYGRPHRSSLPLLLSKLCVKDDLHKKELVLWVCERWQVTSSEVYGGQMSCSLLPVTWSVHFSGPTAAGLSMLSSLKQPLHLILTLACVPTLDPSSPRLETTPITHF